MNRTLSRRIASLAMPVLAAGLIGGGAVAISGAAPAYASPVVSAAASARPAAPVSLTSHRSLGASPAATTRIEPARVGPAPVTPGALHPTSGRDRPDGPARSDTTHRR